jgi:hypothetical protein
MQTKAELAAHAPSTNLRAGDFFHAEKSRLGDVELKVMFFTILGFG